MHHKVQEEDGPENQRGMHNLFPEAKTRQRKGDARPIMLRNSQTQNAEAKGITNSTAGMARSIERPPMPIGAANIDKIYISEGWGGEIRNATTRNATTQVATMVTA